MAISQLKQEQEAQTNSDQLYKLYSFKEEKARYRKSYLEWDKIKRANKDNFCREKAKHLSKDAKAILAPIIQKLEKGERVFLNHKYISTITECERGQNRNIIKQLETVLDITYHNSITHEGKKYRFSYEFAYYKQETSPLENNSLAQFIVRDESLNLSNQASFNTSIENNNTESIDLGSNFLKNVSEEKTQGKNIEYKTTEPQIVELPKEPVRPTKLKKRLANERKKPTNAERKARIYHFNQYEAPQNLSYHYPLTQDDCSKLQSISGRNFDLNAMNELLFDMSKRLDNRFCSKAQFLAYFGKCLRYEMRDSVKINNSNFRIKSNHTDGAGQLQLNRQKQVERYLAEVEQKAITQVSSENQLRARLANILEPLKSYELLSQLKDFKVIGKTMRFYLRGAVQLSDYDQSVVLGQVQSIYSSSELGIEQVEYVIENSTQTVSGDSVFRTKGTMDIPRLEQGIWGDVCRRLIEIYDVHVYNNWFSKLTAITNEQNRTIELKAPNMFTQQWIETNYGETIKEITATLDMEVRLC